MHSNGDVEVIISKFNNPKKIIKCAQTIGCTHVQCVSNHNLQCIKIEDKGMKTAGVTDYTKQTIIMQSLNIKE